MSEAPALVLLSRPDCHLCHEMRALVERLIRGTPLTLRERNVDEDETLRRRYGLAIPVLLLDGAELARHRTDEASLRARLRAAGFATGSS